MLLRLPQGYQSIVVARVREVTTSAPRAAWRVESRASASRSARSVQSSRSIRPNTFMQGPCGCSGPLGCASGSRQPRRGTAAKASCLLEEAPARCTPRCPFQQLLACPPRKLGEVSFPNKVRLPASHERMRRVMAPVLKSRFSGPRLCSIQQILKLASLVSPSVAYFVALHAQRAPQHTFAD